MNPNEIEELLGAYALDAVSDDERREIDAYLSSEPRLHDYTKKVALKVF